MPILNKPQLRYYIMKNGLIALFVLTVLNSSAQIKNNISLFTRPVVIYYKADKKLNACANLYIGYERQVKQWNNRSNIAIGAYGGLLISPQIFRNSTSKLIYTNEEKSRQTIGLTARYNFYVSKDNKLNTFIGITGEINWSKGNITRQNLTGDTLFEINREIDLYPALLPYQTFKEPYKDRYFEFFAEAGGRYCFTKNWGITLSALFSLHTYDCYLNTGVNYRF